MYKRSSIPSFALSVSLLMIAAFFGSKLLPVQGSAQFHVVSIDTNNFNVLDPNVFHLEDGAYQRIGRVSPDDTGFSLELLDITSGCDCVAAIAIPAVWQFVKMQSPEDREVLGSIVSNAIYENVHRLLQLVTAEDLENPLRGVLEQSLSEAMQDPGVQASQENLILLVTERAGPDVMDELRHIMVERFLEGAEVVLRDAAENYGLDFVRGDYDVQPLKDTIDQFLSDPRVLELIGETLMILAEDQGASEAIEIFIVTYMDRLLDAVARSDGLAGYGSAHQTEQFLDRYFSAVEGLVYRNGTAHPVVMAMARNILLPAEPSSDGVVVVLPRGQAQDWFTPQAIFDLAPTEAE